MIARHYIGKRPGVTVQTIGMYCDDRIVGVIVFALPPRETSKRYGGETWELAHLWVDDVVPTNGETWFISQAVKFVRRNHPTIRCLVSYADPSAGHEGTIYRAANWQDDGRTDDDRASPRVDYRDAETGKHYSRRGHVPEGTELVRVPRVSKPRFIYRL